jgi:ergothioneine biosynthesis protein EgtB
MRLPGTPTTFVESFSAAWRRTDMLFGIVAPGAMLSQPIPLRHPFIFYVGHLPAFAWNHVCRGVLGRPSFNPRFDEIFDRGIDPDVDDPSRCHAHPDVPQRWPGLEEVITYRDRVRDSIVDSLADVGACASTNLMARRHRVLSMAIEHELMHQETLLYILQQLGGDAKIRPPDVTYSSAAGIRSRAVAVEEGTATLGVAFDDVDFGWDNEFPRMPVEVPAFSIDSTPVTNEQFHHFVDSGAYHQRAFWTDVDWAWKTRVGLEAPLCWIKQDGGWWYRTMFDRIPLSDAGDWPVYVSLAEAQAYARWSGARLPTEAEFQRAAYGVPDGEDRPFPWGEEPPTARHGNFDFARWSPDPVGSHPDGVSAWGVHDLVGNGWEWTETVFGPFAGFHAYIPGYPGYSADFFDGKHYVLKGASWATAAALIRPSFRNWYQARYPYVFAKFRCVRSGRLADLSGPGTGAGASPRRP